MSASSIVMRAASGELPAWAEAADERRRHMARVSALLGEWAQTLGLSEDEQLRWASVGYLHDALRDADPEALRSLVPTELAGLPDRLLHGPAAAERLRREGVQDHELLHAVAFHTLGHPGLRRLGRALYLADFLEPGRDFLNEWRTELRGRMPTDLHGVTLEVAEARIHNLVKRHLSLRPETVGFWNDLVGRG